MGTQGSIWLSKRNLMNEIFINSGPAQSHINRCSFHFVKLLIGSCMIGVCI